MLNKDNESNIAIYLYRNGLLQKHDQALVELMKTKSWNDDFPVIVLEATDPESNNFKYQFALVPFKA